jgi:phage gpG-like protein
MVFQLSWTIEGEKQLSRRLLIMSDSVKDWTPAFRQTAQDLKNIFSNDVFNTQGRAIQESWKPLSRAYAYQKAQKYPGKGILEATGKMRKSFQSIFKPDYAEVWNSIYYFKYHQSNQPRSKLPRRVMMKLGNQQREMVVRIFNTYFQEITK